MERKTSEALGATFTGSVTFNGPMFDIHDNQNVYIGKGMNDDSSPAPSAAEIPSAADNDGDEELFHFAHPSLDDNQARQVHLEVKRLVRRRTVQDICLYLERMQKEGRVLLPMMPSVAYAELVRMGMPSGEGFSEKNFQKNYRRG